MKVDVATWLRCCPNEQEFAGNLLKGAENRHQTNWGQFHMENKTGRWEAFCAEFGKLAARVAGGVGSPWAFVVAVCAVVLWAITGPYYHYSNTWQLVINTGTTIVTFLMVFLIQNTQNRDARALHLKLDELIRSVKAAHNDMINIEKLSDGELAEMAKRYEAIREEYESRKSQKAA